MRWQNSVAWILGFVLTFDAVALPLTVRTPAKNLDGRFTVKVQLRKGKMKYVVPFWVEPDEKESVIDDKQLHDLGNPPEDRTWDDISISGYSLPVKKFKKGNTEEAYLPEFVKSCCYGTLGKDILGQFQLVAFDDKYPYIEWYKIEKGTDAKPSWFVRDQKFKWQTLKKPLFTFKLVPPERRVIITQKWENIPSGSRLLRIEWRDASLMDLYRIRDYLEGRIEQKIELDFQVSGKVVTVVHSFPWNGSDEGKEN